MKKIFTLLMMCVTAIAAHAQKAPSEPTAPMAVVLTDDNTVTINHDAIVLYQCSNYLYLKYDDSWGYSYCLVYGNVGQIYEKGDVIPKGFGGKRTEYSGEEEITQPFGFQPPIGHVDVVPDDITVPDINHDNWAHYVSLKQVTVSDLNGANFKITDAEGNEAVGYNRFSQVVENGFYEELTGIVDSYGKDQIVYELIPIIEQDTVTVNCLEDLYALDPGQIGRIRLKAIYQYGSYIYVQDFCDQFGLVYGNCGIDISDGDIIEGACTSLVYADNYEVKPIGRWEVISHGPAVEPEVLTIEELTIDMAHWYVKIYDIEFVEELSPIRLLMSDPTGVISIFNRFGIDIPFNSLMNNWESRLDVNHDGEVNIADANHIIEEIITGSHSMNGRKYVIGFVGVYRGEIQIYPIEIGGQRPDCDLNCDNEVNIADLNLIIDYILRH